jgi:aminoglycoside phosphotransferase (APT) family kinase protein
VTGTTTGTEVAEALAGWLTRHTGTPGPWELARLTGGNSNETSLVRGRGVEYVLRRPPRHALSTSAHSVAREHRLLSALAGTAVPAPAPVALCEDPAVPLAPFLVMAHVPGAVSITEALPPAYAGDPAAPVALADAVVDALAAVHRMDWRAAGLEGFGRPEDFLARQVPRWYGQWRSVARRPLPRMDALAGWLDGHRPADPPPALVHGDFHLDNCLFSTAGPRLLAVIDWEMATIGAPLLDLGLLLAFWGERPVTPCAMPRIQAVSRAPGAPSREHLLARYEQATGTAVTDLPYYQGLAFFKLAAIVEAAYTQHLDGQLQTEYAAALEDDVPALLEEAAATVGLSAAH